MIVNYILYNSSFIV